MLSKVVGTIEKPSLAHIEHSGLTCIDTFLGASLKRI